MARAEDPTQLLDDSTPLQERRRSPRVSWLGLLGMLLGLCLLAVALVQARQYSDLQATLQTTGRDFSALTLFESETEYLRLTDKWRALSEGREGVEARSLKLQYDAWVDRVALLRGRQASTLFGNDDEYRRALNQLDAFITAADKLLGQQMVAEPSAAALSGLLPALLALEGPSRALASGISHRLAKELETRADIARSQNQMSLAVTVFLAALTLGFAALVLRQLRRLNLRRAALEGVAAKLRVARTEAEASNRAKSGFLANMSHEIRTPFHGLMGMLSLLRETGLTARQVDYLRTATESADQLLAILNDLLDMSQLESGRMTLSVAQVDLRKLLRDVEAQMRPQAMAKSLALHLDAEPSVPEQLMLDGTRVKQILVNLLSNAIKFSERGAVVLDVRCHARSRKRSSSTPRPFTDTMPVEHELEFEVTDTGPGMSAATLASLFDRQSTVDRPTTRQHGGVGLGLQISRRLARLMHGDITVHSAVGKGSRFMLRLPAVLPPPASDDELAAARMRTMAGRPLQVLVAEDHPVNRQYMAALLHGLGHEGHFAANGTEAVRAASQRQFDLVLMDLHMPGLDGLGATRGIRSLPDPALSTVPIVALTADALDETRERCLVAGMNDFLSKPVSPQKLAASLRRLFGTATASEVLSHHPVDSEVSRANRATPGNPPPTQALVDEAAVTLSLQAMSLDKMVALMETFLMQGPETVQRLRTAVRDAQPLELRVHAHAAKGAALNLGLCGLAATAEALQQGASHLPAHEIARLVQRYEEQLGATRVALSALGLVRLRTRSTDATGVQGSGASGARGLAQPTLKK